MNVVVSVAGSSTADRRHVFRLSATQEPGLAGMLSVLIDPGR